MHKNSKDFDVLQNEIRTRYDSLSKRLKEVARYCLDNNNSVAFDTVAVIAQSIGVPPSTLIRFANALGFTGFNEMKQIFRKGLTGDSINYRDHMLQAPSHDEETNRPDNPSNILNVLSMVNSQALQQLPAQIDVGKLNETIELLLNAENIYVIGLRQSFSVASYLTYALLHLERRAFMIDGLGGMFAEQLSIIQPKDVVVIISYSPYAQEATALVKSSVKNGAKHIVITDSLVSPVAAFSDVCFTMREVQMDGFRSHISAMCLMQALTVSLALRK